MDDNNRVLLMLIYRRFMVIVKLRRIVCKFDVYEQFEKFINRYK